MGILVAGEFIFARALRPFEAQHAPFTVGGDKDAAVAAHRQTGERGKGPLDQAGNPQSVEIRFDDGTVQGVLPVAGKSYPGS